MKVAIIFGSESDSEIMKKASLVLKKFDIQVKGFILSAHRVPEKLEETLVSLEQENYECIIAGAGLAAHLPGVIASRTVIPVIGVPLKGALEGLDSLLSIVQMPREIPVATVGINNAHNAGMLAVQILSVKYPELKKKLLDYRKKMKEEFVQRSVLTEDF